jgi:hypothetical protein
MSRRIATRVSICFNTLLLLHETVPDVSVLLATDSADEIGADALVAAGISEVVHPRAAEPARQIPLQRGLDRRHQRPDARKSLILHRRLPDQRVASCQPPSAAQRRRRQAVLEPPPVIVINERQDPRHPVAVIKTRHFAWFSADFSRRPPMQKRDSGHGGPHRFAGGIRWVFETAISPSADPTRCSRA